MNYKSLKEIDDEILLHKDYLQHLEQKKAELIEERKRKIGEECVRRFPVLLEYYDNPKFSMDALFDSDGAFTVIGIGGKKQ